MINYNEFLSAMVETRMFLKEENVVEAFKMFDKDGKKYITKEDLYKELI